MFGNVESTLYLTYTTSWSARAFIFARYADEACLFIPLLDLIVFCWRYLDSTFRVLSSALEFTLWFSMAGATAFTSGALGISTVTPGDLHSVPSFSVFYLSPEVLANHPRTTILGYTCLAMFVRLLDRALVFYFNLLDIFTCYFVLVWTGWVWFDTVFWGCLGFFYSNLLSLFYFQDTAVTSAASLIDFFYFFIGLCVGLWRAFLELQFIINPPIFFFVKDLFAALIQLARVHASLLVSSVDEFLTLFDAFRLAFVSASALPPVVLSTDLRTNAIFFFLDLNQTAVFLTKKFFGSLAHELCGPRRGFFDKEVLVALLSEGRIGQLSSLFGPCLSYMVDVFNTLWYIIVCRETFVNQGCSHLISLCGGFLGGSMWAGFQPNSFFFKITPRPTSPLDFVFAGFWSTGQGVAVAQIFAPLSFVWVFVSQTYTALTQFVRYFCIGALLGLNEMGGPLSALIVPQERAFLADVHMYALANFPAMG